MYDFFGYNSRVLQMGIFYTVLKYLPLVLLVIKTCLDFGKNILSKSTELNQTKHSNQVKKKER